MGPSWQPTVILSVEQTFTSSTAPSLVQTDAGEAFAKTLGNPEGPHALVCEYVGTALARWLGLPTFEMAIVPYPRQLPTLKYPHGCESAPGPAFVTRAVKGDVWGGEAKYLAYIHNPEAIAGLVVLDTWTRNCDRYRGPPGRERRNEKNVFLSEEAPPGKVRLMAMDHSACFRCDSPLTRKLFQLDLIREERLFGLFPEFVPYVTPERVRPYLQRLSTFREDHMVPILRELPGEWECMGELPEQLTSFCVQRAAFVAQHAESWLGPHCGWHSAPTTPAGDQAET